MLVRTCLALWVVAGVWAQQTQPAKESKKGDAPLTRSSFSAKGLTHEDDLTDFFVGNFADLTFDRGSLAFSQLFQAYLEAYWRHCGTYLRNKVEMTTQVCADSVDPTPRPFGEPPPPTHGCMSWKTVSLGYADPALWAAKNRLDVEQAGNQFKDIVGSITNPLRKVAGIGQLTTDVDALFGLNACVSPGLRRFQENVVLFSSGKPPLLIPGEPPPVAPKPLPAAVLADSDYNRLVEDLVADQAKTWMFNRYVPGSTTLGIVAHDPLGQPSQIRAKYFFTSLAKSARTQGSVIVSFTDGMPACIYFSDAPDKCQTPDRRLVSKYSSGGYLSSVPPNRDAAVQAKAQAEASLGVSICVPDDLLAEWKNPAPGSKVAALQRRLRAFPFFRGHAEARDDTHWITVNSSTFATWNPAGPFNGAITITNGGSCAVGHREFLTLNP